MLAATVASAAFAWHVKSCWQLENAFFREALRRSEAQATRMENKFGKKTIIFGGSSSRTTYIPTVLVEECGVPFANFGLHAGSGADVITEIAMRHANPGDTVVVALEPGFLMAQSASPTKSGGVDFLVYLDGPFPRHLKFVRLSPFRIVERFQGHTRYNLFMIMKLLRRMKPYRYVIEENLHDDGWMEVHEKRALPYDTTPTPVGRWRMGAAGRALIEAIREECERRGCKAVYQLPPSLNGNPNARYGFASLLLDVNSAMPVVKDPMLGVNDDPEDFADTVQHPCKQGALKATRSFGKALSEGAFWTEKELSDIVGEGETLGAFKEKEIRP